MEETSEEERLDQTLPVGSSDDSEQSNEDEENDDSDVSDIFEEDDARIQGIITTIKDALLDIRDTRIEEDDIKEKINAAIDELSPDIFDNFLDTFDYPEFLKEEVPDKASLKTKFRYIRRALARIEDLLILSNDIEVLYYFYHFYYPTTLTTLNDELKDLFNVINNQLLTIQKENNLFNKTATKSLLTQYTLYSKKLEDIKARLLQKAFHEPDDVLEYSAIALVKNTEEKENKLIMNLSDKNFYYMAAMIGKTSCFETKDALIHTTTDTLDTPLQLALKYAQAKTVKIMIKNFDLPIPEDHSEAESSTSTLPADKELTTLKDNLTQIILDYLNDTLTEKNINAQKRGASPRRLQDCYDLLKTINKSTHREDLIALLPEKLKKIETGFFGKYSHIGHFGFFKCSIYLGRSKLRDKLRAAITRELEDNLHAKIKSKLKDNLPAEIKEAEPPIEPSSTFDRRTQRLSCRLSCRPSEAT